MSPRPFQYFSTILDGTSASVVVVVVVVVVVLEYMATAVLERAEREALKTRPRRSELAEPRRARSRVNDRRSGADYGRSKY
eukprot:COSAG06_NODE_1002_length_11132_cov_16.903381_4_plen_81_part_00